MEKMDMMNMNKSMMMPMNMMMMMEPLFNKISDALIKVSDTHFSTSGGL
ncbi:hypothetical protein [Sporolactobacillus vineae]|nr:hypothetical protein [Sporolactobacillus vineae]